MAIQSSAPIMRAKLTQVVGGSATVAFQFNPGKVTVSQSQYAASGRGAVEAATFQEALRSVEVVNITLSEIVLAGSSAKQSADQLMAWLKPVDLVGGTPDSPGTAGPNTYMLPVLGFSWGSSKGLQYNVLLVKVVLNYERFLASGQPVRISATLEMREYPEKLPPPNPTSGGVPGRSQHTVVAEDSLPRIAQDTYGSPRNWRAIAEANGVDDPLRLRWGRRLFLPSPDEVREASTP